MQLFLVEEYFILEISHSPYVISKIIHYDSCTTKVESLRTSVSRPEM